MTSRNGSGGRFTPPQFAKSLFSLPQKTFAPVLGPVKGWASFAFGNAGGASSKHSLQASPLSGHGIFLRHPSRHDYEQWVQVRAASADFLRPWEPTWPEDDLSPIGYKRRLSHYQRDIRSGRALPFFIFRQSDGHLLGGVNVSNIRRGICQMASLGYWMAEDHAGQGHMGKALALLLPYLFDLQRLHRVEAACLPSNAASIAVLNRCGFQQEGRARRYLRINGRWEDHLLFALLREDLQQL